MANLSINGVTIATQSGTDNAEIIAKSIAVDNSVDKFISAGESMPGDKDEIVRIAFERGWVKSAADRNQEAQAELPK